MFDRATIVGAKRIAALHACEDYSPIWDCLAEFEGTFKISKDEAFSLFLEIRSYIIFSKYIIIVRSDNYPSADEQEDRLDKIEFFETITYGKVRRKSVPPYFYLSLNEHSPSVYGQIFSEAETDT